MDLATLNPSIWLNSDTAQAPSAPTEALAAIRVMVERQPNALAIYDGTHRLTYLEFWNAVQSVAARVITASDDDAPVLILVGADVESAVAVFGVLLAGRAACYIDRAGSADRTSAILADLRPTLILHVRGTSSELVEEVEAMRVSIDLALPLPAEPIKRPVGRDEIMGIVYTSGSTGRPKGVAFPVSGFEFIIARALEQGRLTPADRFVIIGALNPVGMGDILMALIQGASVRIVDLKSAGLTGVLDVMRTEEITVFDHVPTMVLAIARLPVSAGGICEPAVSLPKWRAPQQSGACDTSRCPAVGLRDPRELRVERSLYSLLLVDRRRALHGAAGSTWVPRCSRRIAMVDEDGAPVRPGEAGEVVVSDDNVALGDWRNGALDRSRFPVNIHTGKRTYAVGDVLRQREDGLFEFVGRRDRMVKVRGLRVDLAEVEMALKAHPAISDAAVVAQSRSDQPFIVAFVVTRPGAEVGNADLRQTVAQGTAPHMVPHAFERIASIPQLYNGKPDLVKLAAGVLTS